MRMWRAGRFRGANGTLDLSRDDLADLARSGANLVRITLGPESVDPDPPYGLRSEGMARFDRILDGAREAGLKVVLALAAAPGRRDATDRRLWEQPQAHLAFARVWGDLAKRYQGNATLAAYDLLSEPNPELVTHSEHREAEVAGTTADWNVLAKRLTLAVRAVDPDRPLIVEAGAWAYARGFAWLRPTGDPNTVYSFHIFSPHRYTHQEPGENLRYPGVVPAHVEPEGRWDKAALMQNLLPALEFARKNNTPIYVGEFGVRRTAPDDAVYVKDLLMIFEEAGWHWTFWSYRDSGDWNPEWGPQPDNRAPQALSRAPLMRLYREFMALNDHPWLLADLPLLKEDDWVQPMRAVHQNFTGDPGAVGLLGDSITYGHQFFTPLFANGAVADSKTIADLRRFRQTLPPEIAEWKTAIHGNQGGWRITNGLPKLDEALIRDNPEIAFVMFGTNDMNDGPPDATRYETNLRRYVEQLLQNGTVPILSTLPPKKGYGPLVAAYNDVIRRVARALTVPLVDYHGAIMRRRPRDWYRTLIMGDGVHPTFPPEFQKDMTEAGLRESGFTLRNYLTLEATLAVLDRLRQP